MTAEPEAVVRAFLAADSAVDLDALRGLLTDDVELHGRRGLSAQGVDAFLASAEERYDHLDDVFSLVGSERDGDDVVGRVRRELRWRETGKLSAHRESTIRYTLRGGRIARVQLVDSTPWERG
ncbi:MAG: nuclear transport factor 2 family protein [Gaiellaceae bacterium]